MEMAPIGGSEVLRLRQYKLQELDKTFEGAARWSEGSGWAPGQDSPPRELRAGGLLVSKDMYARPPAQLVAGKPRGGLQQGRNILPVENLMSILSWSCYPCVRAVRGLYLTIPMKFLVLVVYQSRNYM